MRYNKGLRLRGFVWICFFLLSHVIPTCSYAIQNYIRASPLQGNINCSRGEVCGFGEGQDGGNAIAGHETAAATS